MDQDRKALTELRRLLRPLGYRVLLASGAHEAFAIMEKAEVDILVSAMGLPRMSGTQFLAEAAERWPHVLRILLAPYSDMPAAERAVKEGRIYRFLSKPWKERDLKLLIAQAVELRHLFKDKLQLLAAVRKQREELVRIRNDLDTRVKERTAEVLRAAGALRLENQKLKENYASAVQVAVDMLSEGLGVDGAQAFLEKQERHDQTVVQAFLDSLVADAESNDEQPVRGTQAEEA